MRRFLNHVAWQWLRNMVKLFPRGKDYRTFWFSYMSKEGPRVLLVRSCCPNHATLDALLICDGAHGYHECVPMDRTFDDKYMYRILGEQEAREIGGKPIEEIEAEFHGMVTGEKPHVH